ncbi:hypothetical protein [Dechloromonas agitata]|uniref:hypothetical protein n=1 Tax=Dechloromonas agitata TaxID=73030 RepID=UPI0012FCF1A6|nr:hypothetical protein [Dechloromonas agitata]
MEEFNIDPLWHLHDELSLHQAAALIAGYDPGVVERCMSDTNHEERFSRLYPAESALMNAIRAGKLKASLRFDAEPRFVAGLDNLRDRAHFEGEEVQLIEHENLGELVITREPNWVTSSIALEDLKAWLLSRGARPAFFFPEKQESADYLDTRSPRYAPKLAAAVRAWQAVTDPNGKHPKQALSKWIRENAAKFGLADEEGKPNETGVEEVAKVANWQPGGGAPKTPGE